MCTTRRRFLGGAVLAAGSVTGCLSGSPFGGETPTGPAGRTTRQVGEGPLAVTDGNAAYVTRDGELRAVDVSDGSERWRVSTGETAALHLTGGRLFSLGADGTVRSHDTGGDERWTATLGVEGVSLVGGAGGAVAAGADGTVVSLRSGDERWRGMLDETPRGVAVGDERVLVATDGWLTALRAADGAQAWREHPGVAVTSPPYVVGDRVYVGVEHPGHEAGDPTPSPVPQDDTAAGALVAADTTGGTAPLGDVEGRVRWVRDTSAGLLVGFAGFEFEDPVHGVVDQVALFDAAGGRQWLSKDVPFVRPAAVTQGVALHVHPDAVAGDSDDGRRDARGATAVRVGSGATVWTDSDPVATAAAAGETFVVVTPDAIVARDALSGATGWEVDG